MEKKNQLKSNYNAPLYSAFARMASTAMTNGADSFSRSVIPQGFYAGYSERNVKAFTLIELLVVVLIIGILAAVALPQYTLAVNKTRFANLRSAAHPYLQAMRAYHLANGEWPNDLDELSVTPPVGMSRSNHSDENYDCVYNDEFYCCMQGSKNGDWASGMMCGQKDYSFIYSNLLDNTTYSPTERPLCLAKTTDTNANKLCKALSQTGSYLSGGVTTPDGRKFAYKYYVVKQ